MDLKEIQLREIIQIEKDNTVITFMVSKKQNKGMTIKKKTETDSQI